MKPRPSHSVIVCVCCLLFLSNTAIAQMSTTRPPAREYVIGVGDALDILVWGFPEFSSKVEVRSDGKITLPMLGDLQAAQLTTSLLKAKLASGDLIGKYVSNPNITITVARSAQQITLTINGRSQTVPRGTAIGQLLAQFVPTLQPDPAPNLAAIKIMGVNEEFTVNWPALEAGSAPEMNILLEWGDEIVIPAVGVVDSPAGMAILPETLTIKTFTREELSELLSDVPPEKLDMLLAIAAPTDDGRYTIDLSKISAEQKQQIGDDILARLFPPEPSQSVVFTDIGLLGIAVNLAAPNGVVAFLSIPNSEQGGIPEIRQAVEEERIKEGETPEEDIVLQEIDDVERLVRLKKGEEFQEIRFLAPSGNIKLSGIRKEGAVRKASFLNLPKTSAKKPPKWSFAEDETLPDGAKIAQITDEWVLLQRNAAFELLLLRDSYNRKPAAAPVVAAPKNPEENAGDLNNPQKLLENGLRSELLKKLPEPVKALNTFSKLFFATPVIE